MSAPFFKKIVPRIRLKIDSSEDIEVNIKELQEYQMQIEVEEFIRSLPQEKKMKPVDALPKKKIPIMTVTMQIKAVVSMRKVMI